MYRIDNATAAASLDSPTSAGPNPNGYFTGGNPGAGTPATIVEAEYLNMIQEELMSVLTAASISPSKAARNQLATAINSLIAAASATQFVRGTSSPVWASTTTLTVARIDVVTASGVRILKTGSTTINGATTGLNGLTAGALASNAKYFLYAISQAGGANPGLILSTVDEGGGGTFTGMPSGYTERVQLGAVWPTNGSAQFFKGQHQFILPNFAGRFLFSDFENVSAYQVGTTTTTGSWVAMSAANWLPGRAKIGLFHVAGTYTGASSVASVAVRATSSGLTTGAYVLNTNTSADLDSQQRRDLAVPLVSGSPSVDVYLTNTGGTTRATVFARGFDFEV